MCGPPIPPIKSAPCKWPVPRGRRGESGQATPRTKGTHVNYEMKKHRKEGTGGFDLSFSAPDTCPWATNLSTFWRASKIAMIAAFFFTPTSTVAYLSCAPVRTAHYTEKQTSPAIFRCVCRGANHKNAPSRQPT